MTNEQITEVLSEIRSEYNCFDESERPFYHALSVAIEALSAQPERKGEWCHQNDDYYDWYECSECGYGDEGEMIMSREFDVRTNFCPNCGADMRGEEDERDS